LFPAVRVVVDLCTYLVIFVLFLHAPSVVEKVALITAILTTLLRLMGALFVPLAAERVIDEKTSS
jgi:hypothetical protein